MSKQKSIQRTGLEQIQKDAKSPSVTIEKKPDVQGGGELQSALGEMADSFRMSGFKCAHEKCGLVHNHDTTKHRFSDSSDMSDEEAASMEANPNCHCGLNNAAKDGHEDAPTPSRANSMAPIPDSMARHIDSL